MPGADGDVGCLIGFGVCMYVPGPFFFGDLRDDDAFFQWGIDHLAIRAEIIECFFACGGVIPRFVRCKWFLHAGQCVHPIGRVHPEAVPAVVPRGECPVAFQYEVLDPALLQVITQCNASLSTAYNDGIHDMVFTHQSIPSTVPSLRRGVEPRSSLSDSFQVTILCLSK